MAINRHKRATDARMRATTKAQRELAFAAAPVLADFTAQLFSGLNVEISPVNLKTRRGLSTKAEKDYGKVMSSVGDAVRLKVTCDDWRDIEQARHRLWRKRELVIARYGKLADSMEHPSEPLLKKISDAFAEPMEHGYRAINTKLRMPNGVIAEIQVVHRAMENENQRTHGAYDQLKELLQEVGDDPFTMQQAERYETLVGRLTRMYDPVAAANGLNNLLSGDAARKIAEREQRMQRIKVAARVLQDPDSSGQDRDIAKRLARPSNRHGRSPLDRQIDSLLALRDKVDHDGIRANPEEALALARGINRFAAQWERLPDTIQERLVETGLALNGRTSRSFGAAQDGLGQKTLDLVIGGDQVGANELTKPSSKPIQPDRDAVAPEAPAQKRAGGLEPGF
ncbi:MAG: hypothetical protein KI792_09410 [Alphaproteobacteria bacterium]|nr:hypothetical protein [Alphaproteobacteria bacterium SS10]